MKSKTYVIKNKFRFYTFIGLILSLLLLFISFLYKDTAQANIANTYSYVVVEKGDTLWSIATEKYPKTDLRKYIYEIKKINNFTSAKIVPGQVIKLPDLVSNK